jgi:hypothetical protein
MCAGEEHELLSTYHIHKKQMAKSKLCLVRGFYVRTFLKSLIENATKHLRDSISSFLPTEEMVSPHLPFHVNVVREATYIRTHPLFAGCPLLLSTCNVLGRRRRRRLQLWGRMVHAECAL